MHKAEKTIRAGSCYAIIKKADYKYLNFKKNNSEITKENRALKSIKLDR